MDFIGEIFSYLLHLDRHLAVLIQKYGAYTYVIFFLIVFCETGLVVTPFLPGDSLLFAAGTFCALGSLNVHFLSIILIVSAILGDTVNYWIGNKFGERILSKNNKLIKKEHLIKTQKFYEKHGGKTIILARFVPIVRTFAPFVAGIGKMNYSKFLTFNVVGGIAWVVIFVYGGYFFGNIPIIKNNFTITIMIIILLSITPGLIEYVRHKLEKRKIANLP
ncbi:MAG: DedA family protein [Proteobacteria bacterium]|nr:DedA family protein [Pseudomonadota bacterium]